MTLEFNSFDEMFAHFGESGAGTVADIVDLEKIAQEESEVLKHLITVSLASYFLSYEPSGRVERTGRTMDSLKISPIIDENGYVSFGVYFDPELALHPSVLNGEPGNTAWLLDSGWELKHWSKNRIPNFTDFLADSPGDGTHYLRSAVENYNSTNPYGIVAQIFIDNELFEG